MNRRGPSPALLVALWLLQLSLAPASAPAAPAGTLDGLVESFDARVGRALAGATPARIDLALSLGQGPGVSVGLVQAVRALLLDRLNRRSFRRVGVVTEGGGAAARRLACRRDGFERLLDLELIVVEGHLHLRGTLVATDRQLWRDTLGPQVGALNHLHEKVRVDAEVRAYTGQETTGKVRFVTRAYLVPHLERVLALGVGDLDGDGRAELVVLRPGGLEVLRYRGGQSGFERVAGARVIPPAAALRSRRAIGALALVDLDRDGKAEVLARSSEMKLGAVFALRGRDLQRLSDLPGYPLAARPGGAPADLLLGQALPGQDQYDPASLVGPLAASLPQELVKGLVGFYTLKQAAIAKRGAAPQRFTGVVDAAGALRVHQEGRPGPLVALSSVGIAFELADLDDDGSLELVTTTADNLGEKDQITVTSVEEGKSPRLIWRSAGLQGAVMSMGHGDLDGDGKLEIVAALESPQQAADGGVTLLVLEQ